MYNIHLNAKSTETKRLPPLGWVPSYDLDMLTGDFIAGVTTALTVIPQGIGRSLWHRKYGLPIMGIISLHLQGMHH